MQIIIVPFILKYPVHGVEILHDDLSLKIMLLLFKQNYENNNKIIARNIFR
jgi:hypothetical protein